MLLALESLYFPVAAPSVGGGSPPLPRPNYRRVMMARHNKQQRQLFDTLLSAELISEEEYVALNESRH